MPHQGISLDLERGIRGEETQSAPDQEDQACQASYNRRASAEPPEVRLQLTRSDTQDSKPEPHKPALSLGAYTTRPMSPSPPDSPGPGSRSRDRSSTSHPERKVHKPRRASSVSSLRAASTTLGYPHHNPRAPPQPLGGSGGSVTLQPGDAVSQGRWVVDLHRDELIREVVGAERQSTRWFKSLLGITEPAPKKRIFRVSFAELQRMKLRKLQVKLVNHAVDMFAKNEESKGWEEDLAQYTQAMRDYDYMLEVTKLPNDYFYATGERAVDRYVIRRLVGDLSLDGTLTCDPVELWGDDKSPIGGTRYLNARKTRMKAFWERMCVATIGGVLLLGPMWLMMLHDDLYTRLITTTACVAFLGMFNSLWLEKSDQVLQITAAYAAVLVVFVGLTNSGS